MASVKEDESPDFAVENTLGVHVSSGRSQGPGLSFPGAPNPWVLVVSETVQSVANNSVLKRESVILGGQVQQALTMSLAKSQAIV